MSSGASVLLAISQNSCSREMPATTPGLATPGTNENSSSRLEFVHGVCLSAVASFTFSVHAQEERVQRQARLVDGGDQMPSEDAVYVLGIVACDRAGAVGKRVQAALSEPSSSARVRASLSATH